MKANESIRKIRIESGHTQEEIARALNVNAVTYLNYEKGKRNMSIEAYIKLADFYNISLDELVGRDFFK